MRIIQLIDSLEIGGAEKMAVNYANALSGKIEFSGLIVTRKEGNLKSHLSETVSYLFLNRKRLIDISAILRLKKFLKLHKITHIQAHSSSFFTAVLVKVIYFKIKIIWHDHNGLSEFLSNRKNIALKIASYFFEGIVVVNEQLLHWAKRTLNCNKIIYFPNFTVLNHQSKQHTILKGVTGKKIISVANLRFQKNHFFLLDVAARINKKYPDWSFHLLGKDFQDDYSNQIKKKIQTLQLKETVFLYDSVEDVQHCISQAQIAIITSQSEGLPVVLLEFGLLQLPIVSTAVGEIPNIIINEENGYLVAKSDSLNFTQYLQNLIENPNERNRLAINLNQTILKNHSQEEIMRQYLNWLSK